MLEQLITTRAI